MNLTQPNCPPSSGKEWSVEELKSRLDKREKLFVFDVRNAEEFAAGKLEGVEKLPTLNLPYFDILERGGKDDVAACVAAVMQNADAPVLPKRESILTVCAKGGTSALVAEGLRKAGFDAVNLRGGMKAWGDFYEFKAVAEERAFGIYQVSRPARGCLSYVIASEGEAVVLDPLRHAANYIEFGRRQNFRIKFVLDTHGHADHISGGRALADACDALYLLHPYDAIHPVDVLPARVSYEPLRNGQEFSFGRAMLKAIHIPGHTLGEVVFLLNEKYLFAGDSIFIESIARPDLGGHGETWSPLYFQSLQKLLRLANETLVLPGHFSRAAEANARGVFAATLGDLKRNNEGLRIAQKTEGEFVKYILASLPVFPPQYVDIKRVNAGLLAVDEEKASELELGKNVCALAHAAQA